MESNKLPFKDCISCPCWNTDGSCLKDSYMESKCRNCKFAHYEPQHGYVCTNSDSENIADFLDGNDWCDKFEKRSK